MGTIELVKAVSNSKFEGSLAIESVEFKSDDAISPRATRGASAIADRRAVTLRSPKMSLGSSTACRKDWLTDNEQEFQKPTGISMIIERCCGYSGIL